MAPMVIATFSSSSTISTLPVAILCWTPNWKGHAESRAPALAASKLDRTAVRLDDALRDPQSQTGALLVFAREERLEDVRQVLLLDALACIAHLDVHRVR